EEHRMDNFRRQVKESIAYDKIVFELISRSEVDVAVMEFMERIPCDIIAVSRSKKNFFDRLTTRSVSRNMVLHPVKPLLVFHAEKPSSTPLF
ncbi:MAG: hypothetical protein ACKO1U_08345, partial [Bacteroidota bacterium]